MMLLSAFRFHFNSTTVRFLMLFVLSLNLARAAEQLNWRRDSAREQQVAERIYQWQKRGHFTQQYCWQALHVDDKATSSVPEQRLLAAHESINDVQLRADYLRQQWFCLLQQQPAIRAAGVEQLRRHFPFIRIRHGDLTARYSELLAAQLTLQWLRANGEQQHAEIAQAYWQRGRDGDNYAALITRRDRSEKIANTVQRELLPKTQQWATFKP